VSADAVGRLFVVDTNVVVSGVLAREGQSPPALIVDALLQGRLPFVLSADLLSEYRDVLLRPPIAARHRLSPADIDALLAELTTVAYLRQPPAEEALDPEDRAPSEDPAPITPPGDEHIVSLLTREPRAALVSGDQRLVEALRGWREVLTPAEFVERTGLQR
jgi:predicted nucleic acid-binding protein